MNSNLSSFYAVQALEERRGNLHPHPYETEYPRALRATPARITRSSSRISEAKVIENQIIKQRINDWVTNGGIISEPPNRDKKIASERIRKSYNLESNSLVLSGLNLVTLPDIFDCSIFIEKLEILKVDYNNLASLPDSIGKLRNLKQLWVDNNYLLHLPETFDNLINIQKFTVKNNCLTELPAWIGNMSRLSELDLSDNNLIRLPSNIGLLQGLISLKINRNPRFEVFPPELINCPHLEILEAENTRIASNLISHINTTILTFRSTSEAKKMSDRMEEWIASSGNEYLIPLFHWNESQQDQINDWLMRLEKTREYSINKKQLASVICKILVSLQKSENFQEAFFNLLSGNLDQCGDRAAMLLNLIYTEWQLCELAEEATDADKIRLLSKLAKTLTLRKVIDDMIFDYEKNYCPVGESVEIYLYFEMNLKDCLGLDSIISTMHYETIGNRISIINKDALIIKVKENWLDTLIGLSILDSILEKSKELGQEYREKREEILEKGQEKLECLQMETSDGAYLREVNGIQKAIEASFRNLKTHFIKKFL